MPAEFSERVLNFNIPTFVILDSTLYNVFPAIFDDFSAQQKQFHLAIFSAWEKLLRCVMECFSHLRRSLNKR